MSEARLLDANKEALSNRARLAGEICARTLFAPLGNPSEVHLNEYELALFAAAAAEMALQTYVANGARS